MSTKKNYLKDYTKIKKVFDKAIRVATNPGSGAGIELDEYKFLQELRNIEDIAAKYNPNSRSFFLQLRVLYFQLATEVISQEQFVAMLNNLCAQYNINGYRVR